MRLINQILWRRGFRFTEVQPDINSGVMPLTKKYANLPERYMARKSRKLVYMPPDPHPVFDQEIRLTGVHKQNGASRPWNKNHPLSFYAQKKGIASEPIRNQDWMWFIGDRVEIVDKHCKDFGKQGVINYVVQEHNWVFIEGLNRKWRDEDDNSDWSLEEMPLIANKDIKLVDPVDEIPADEVEWCYTEHGERIRVVKASGTIIPIPRESDSTADYVTPNDYMENKDKDTPSNIVSEITFKPQLKTFEMDIMDEMGIEETRTPQRTYFY